MQISRGRQGLHANHRTIIHLDLDCFYAQVEQKRLGIPAEVPCAVQQWEGLIAINYAARAQGITRHMRVHEAKARCPELVCVHVQTIGGDVADTKDRTKQKACLERYRKACIQILGVLIKAAPQATIEKASIDEVYIDVTSMVDKELQERAAADNCKEAGDQEGGPSDAGGSPIDAFAWGSIVLGDQLDISSEFDRRLSIGASIACRLRGVIRKQLGFTSSAGIAANKLLAKISSALNKPNQQTIVPPRAVDGLMKDLPLKKLRNFGGKLGAELGEMQCTTAGQVAALPHKALVSRFGEERATIIARAVRGYSDEPVQVKELPKSMLAAKSFNATSQSAQLDMWMQILAEELADRLAEDSELNNRRPRTLTLYYRGSQGDRSKAGSAPRPGREGYCTALLQEAGAVLLRKCYDIYPCTRLALQASDFVLTPMSEDQGAITRFFSGNQTQNMGGKEEDGVRENQKTEGNEASARAAAHQHSIASLFKKAAAAKPSAAADKAGNAPHDSSSSKKWDGTAARAELDLLQATTSHDEIRSAKSQQQLLQREGKRPSAADSAGARRKSADERNFCGSAARASSEPHADSVRQQTTVASMLERVSPQSKTSRDKLPASSGSECQQHCQSSTGEPGSEADRSAAVAAAEAQQADRQDRTTGKGPCPDSSELANQAPRQAASCEASAAQGSGGRAVSAAHRWESGRSAKMNSAAPTEAPRPQDSAAILSEPDHPHMQSSDREGIPPRAAFHDHNASQDRQVPPEEVLPDVDVEEQRRIMRDIWLRQHVNRDSPRATDSSKGTLAKKRQKRESEHGAAGDAGPKQLRINAMFKAPAK